MNMKEQPEGTRLSITGHSWLSQKEKEFDYILTKYFFIVKNQSRNRNTHRLKLINMLLLTRYS